MTRPIPDYQLLMLSSIDFFRLGVMFSLIKSCVIYHMYTIVLCFHVSVGVWPEKNKMKNFYKNPTWFEMGKNYT